MTVQVNQNPLKRTKNQNNLENITIVTLEFVRMQQKIDDLRTIYK